MFEPKCKCPYALIVCEDDDLRATFALVFDDLGWQTHAAELRDLASCVESPARVPDLVLVCMGQATPEELLAIQPLLASPLIEGTALVLATTTPSHRLPPLPPTPKGATMTYLPMPFELAVLEEIVATGGHGHALDRLSAA